MCDIAKQEAAVCSMDDQSDVGIHAQRPKLGISGFVELVKLQAGMGGVELDVEGGGLDGLLLVRVSLARLW